MTPPAAALRIIYSGCTCTCMYGADEPTSRRADNHAGRPNVRSIPAIVRPWPGRNNNAATSRHGIHRVHCTVPMELHHAGSGSGPTGRGRSLHHAYYRPPAACVNSGRQVEPTTCEVVSCEALIISMTIAVPWWLSIKNEKLQSGFRTVSCVEMHLTQVKLCS